MSRKSARLRGLANKPQRPDNEDRSIPAPSRKRKAEEELDRSMEEVSKRRQQFQIQNQWIPISLHHAPIQSSTIIPTSAQDSPPTSDPILPPTPQSNTTPLGELPTPPQTSPSHLAKTGSTFRFQNFFTKPRQLRDSPLPSLQWADSREVWQCMLEKEELYHRDAQVLTRHPVLQSRMRSILLDWIIEVCEVYRLHRETFYLAVDFIDRYLSITKNIQKQQLQLIGITALFVAAKLEEIYPPKLTEFAYVTDGACTENEILDQELVMLKALKWDLSPMTCNSWLNVFLQLVNVENMDREETQFVIPQYSSHAFIQIARLLDLCLLDLGCLQFTYSVLATSAMYHMSSEHVALSVSGYEWMDIAPCVQWMSPFAVTLREIGPAELKFFSQISHEDTHNIQTHMVDLSLLEKAQSLQEKVKLSSRASPDNTKVIPGIITPPHSKGKSRTHE